MAALKVAGVIRLLIHRNRKLHPISTGPEMGADPVAVPQASGLSLGYSSCCSGPEDGVDLAAVTFRGKFI
jgi:hypothetical protein